MADEVPAVPPAADPAPLGLAAFALTTCLLSAHNAGWAPDFIWIGPAFFYGGPGTAHRKRRPRVFIPNERVRARARCEPAPARARPAGPGETGPGGPGLPRTPAGLIRQRPDRFPDLGVSGPGLDQLSQAICTICAL